MWSCRRCGWRCAMEARCACGELALWLPGRPPRSRSAIARTAASGRDRRSAWAPIIRKTKSLSSERHMSIRERRRRVRCSGFHSVGLAVPRSSGVRATIPGELRSRLERSTTHPFHRRRIRFGSSLGSDGCRLMSPRPISSRDWKIEHGGLLGDDLILISHPNSESPGLI